LKYLKTIYLIIDIEISKIWFDLQDELIDNITFSDFRNNNFNKLPILKTLLPNHNLFLFVSLKHKLKCMINFTT